MVYIRRAVMIMEPPSPATIAKRDALEREKLGGGETSLGKRKRTDEGDGTVRKKKKVSKEPNPLSVKKKKRVVGTQPVREDGNKSYKEGVAEENVVGEVTESTRRQKSTRKRKHHKRSSKLETIPAESNTCIITRNLGRPSSSWTCRTVSNILGQYQYNVLAGQKGISGPPGAPA